MSKKSKQLSKTPELKEFVDSIESAFSDELAEKFVNIEKDQDIFNPARLTEEVTKKAIELLEICDVKTKAKLELAVNEFISGKIERDNVFYKLREWSDLIAEGKAGTQLEIELLESLSIRIIFLWYVRKKTIEHIEIVNTMEL
ncbi:MAG: hypothetical protein WC623_22045 [Pedobacter sp.]|uniref:hypothetical protein n=1 Tax=Pedobacter sp. TaxID=1411316 RepID=UPI0035676FA9